MYLNPRNRMNISPHESNIIDRIGHFSANIQQCYRIGETLKNNDIASQHPETANDVKRLREERKFREGYAYGAFGSALGPVFLAVGMQNVWVALGSLPGFVLAAKFLCQANRLGDQLDRVSPPDEPARRSSHKKSFTGPDKPTL